MFRKLSRTAFLLLSGCIVLLQSACVKDRVDDLAVIRKGKPVDPGARTLIHYWDFNGSGLLQPAFTKGGGIIETNDVYDDTEGTLLNARNGSDSGDALRMRNPSTFMVIKAPTTGYSAPLLRFAVMRTNNGPKENIIEYTTDGIHFSHTGMPSHIINVTPEWTLYSIDFTGLAGVDDNPDFAIRITFSVGNTNESGNDRYDNISIDALADADTQPDPPGPPTPPGQEEDSLIHYWNFNQKSSLLAPTSGIGGGSISYAAVWDDVNEGTMLNARNDDPAGYALRLRNPAGDCIISVPTTGFKQIIVKYAVMRTNNGAATNNISYSTDGNNFTQAGLTNKQYTVTPSFAEQVLDFSDIAGASDNPHFKIKISFADGHDNDSGNNRFDNLTVEGKRLQ